ncbi:MAG TPA: hypothetical protein VJU78_16790 [Chitinophagaceae bacterium]|nr:hypothetical protein [Chitinophagaceae bacterium]
MKNKIKQTRYWIIFFMVALFLSGLTAIPLESELAFLSRSFSPTNVVGAWIQKVYLAIAATNKEYPFLAYGYDWLAFAHFVLAILFIGPLRDPLRNKWVIEFGMIACVLIIPFAFIAGHFRSIPIGWRLIDCSFGVIGLIPLSICLGKITEIEKLNNKISQYEITL